jgi:hypothetical protein
MSGASHDEFSGDILLYAPREIERPRIVQRHRNGAAKNASTERRNPFRAVWAPDQDAIAFHDSEL